MAFGRRISVRLILGLALLTMVSGCRWLPMRPDDKRDAAPKIRESEPVMPPLPPLHSIGDDEAFQPAAPTPLLDAIAERDESVKRALASKVEFHPPQSVELPQIPTTPLDPAEPKPDPSVEPASFVPPPSTIEPKPIEVPVAEPQDISQTSLWDYVLTALAVDATPEPETPLLAQAQPEFTISDLRICKRVLGFGRTEPISSEFLVAGRQVLLYCEIEGVRDQECAGGFRSRIASTVAILPAAGGSALWEFDLGSAEDLCQRRRRDFFVNYRVTIPASLVPGDYLIRLVQKDLLAGRESSKTLPLTVRAK